MLRITLFITLAALLLLGLNVSVYANQATIDKIELAYRQANVTALEELAEISEGYDRNLAGYRLSMLYNLKVSREAADDTIQKVADRLREHLESTPNDVESWALLSSSYGLMIAYKSFRGMTHDPKASHALSKAYALDSENPRVKLVDGIAKYNTPPVFGGSVTRAAEVLTRAIKAFPADADSGFHWGLADAYIWRGLARFKSNDKNNALSDWRKALEIAPNHQWANRLLEKHL